MQEISIPVVIGEDYGTTFKRRIEQYGITQREVAAEAGITESQLSRWVGGRPSPDTGKPMDARFSNIINIERAILAIRQRREKAKKRR